MKIASHVVFRWSHCPAGYEVVERDAAELMEAKKMPFIGISKRVLETLPRPLKSLSIEPRTKKLLTAEPLTHFPGLFRDFADLKFSAVDYASFAEKFGLLHHGQSMNVLFAESFHVCVRRALGLNLQSVIADRYPMDDVDPTDGWSITSTGAHPDLVAVPDRDAIPPKKRLMMMVQGGCLAAFGENKNGDGGEFQVRPKDLMTAIALQTLSHLSGTDDRDGLKLMRCHRCGTHWKAGAGTNKRNSGKYCSSRCEGQANYARRKAEGYYDTGKKSKSTKPAS